MSSAVEKRKKLVRKGDFSDESPLHFPEVFFWAKENSRQFSREADFCENAEVTMGLGSHRNAIISEVTPERA